MKLHLCILMASYNNESYIRQAIDSVISQDSEDWTLIICDDCSTDNTLGIITPCLDNPKIKLIKNHKNLGYTRSLIKLIETADTDLVGILDSDDILAKNAVNSVLKASSLHKECGLIYSQYQECDSRMNNCEPGTSAHIPAGHSNLELDRITHFKVFKLNDYHKTSGYNTKLDYAEDADLIFKLEEVTTPLFIDKVLYKYRVLPHSISHDPCKRNIGAFNHLKAQYYAYRRRLGTNLPSISKDIMKKRVVQGIKFSLAQHQLLESIELTAIYLRLII